MAAALSPRSAGAPEWEEAARSPAPASAAAAHHFVGDVRELKAYEDVMCCMQWVGPDVLLACSADGKIHAVRASNIEDTPVSTCVATVEGSILSAALNAPRNNILAVVCTPSSATSSVRLARSSAGSPIAGAADDQDQTAAEPPLPYRLYLFRIIQDHSVVGPGIILTPMHTPLSLPALPLFPATSSGMDSSPSISAVAIDSQGKRIVIAFRCPAQPLSAPGVAAAVSVPRDAPSMHAPVTLSSPAAVAENVASDAAPMQRVGAKANPLTFGDKDAKDAKDGISTESAESLDNTDGDDTLFAAGDGGLLNLNASITSTGSFAAVLSTLMQGSATAKGASAALMWGEAAAAAATAKRTDSLAFGGTQKSLASSLLMQPSAYATILGFDLQTGKALCEMTYAHEVCCLAWRYGDSSMVLAGSDDGVVQVWDTSKHRSSSSLRRSSSTSPFLKSTKKTPPASTLSTKSSSPAILPHPPSSTHIKAGRTSSTNLVPPDASKPITSSKSVVRWDAHQGRVEALVLSHSGFLLASVSSDKSAVIFALKSSQIIRRIPQCCTDWVTCLSWHPNDAYLATGGFDRLVRIWHVESGEAVRSFQGHQGGLTALAWQPSGCLLASAACDFAVRLWAIDLPAVAPGGGPHAAQFAEGHDDDARSVCWCPGGSRLVSGADDNSARIWHKESGELLKVLTGCQGWVNAVAWAPTMVPTCGSSAQVEGVAEHRRGTRNVDLIACASADGHVHLFDANSGLCEQKLPHDGDWVQAVAWSDNGQYLASGTYGDERQACVWVWSQAALTTSEVANAPTSSDDHQHSQQQRSSSSSKINFKLLRKLTHHEGPVNCVSWHTNGTLLASGSDDGTVAIWDGIAGLLLCTITDAVGEVRSVRWSKQPHTLKLACAWQDSVRLYDLHDTLGKDDAVPGNAGNASGERPVLTGVKAQLVLQGHGLPVLSVEWSADGHSVVSSSRDHTVRLWLVNMPISASTAASVHGTSHEDHGKMIQGNGHVRISIAEGDSNSNTVAAPVPDHPSASIPTAPSSLPAASFELDAAVHSLSWHPVSGLCCACSNGRIVQLGVVAPDSPEGVPAQLKWNKSFRRSKRVVTKPAAGSSLPAISETHLEHELGGGGNVARPTPANGGGGGASSKVCIIL